MLRQAGAAATDGTVAAVTGERCFGQAGDLFGDGFTVQPNMMASPAVTVSGTPLALSRPDVSEPA